MMDGGGGEMFQTLIQGLSSSDQMVRIVEFENKGRGVIAARNLSKGEVIQRCPCIHCPESQYKHLKLTIFEEYLFKCKDGSHLLPLGIGCLFNHSNKPNVDYRVDKDENVITFVVSKPVKAGDELCIFYGFDLWFKVSSNESDDGYDTSASESGEEFPFAKLALD